MRTNLILRRYPLDRAVPVQRSTVQVSLRGIVRGGDEVNTSLFLVDAGNADRVIHSRCQHHAGLIDTVNAVQMLPSVAFAEPEKALAIVDPMPGLHHLHPCVIPVGEERLNSAGFCVAGDHLVCVLQPVELLENHKPGILCPFHLRNVVIPRVGIRSKPASFPAVGLDDSHTAGGVGLAGLRVGVGGDRGI